MVSENLSAGVSVHPANPTGFSLGLYLGFRSDPASIRTGSGRVADGDRGTPLGQRARSRAGRRRKGQAVRVMPVIIGEYGTSSNGSTPDANGTQAATTLADPVRALKGATSYWTFVVAKPAGAQVPSRCSKHEVDGGSSQRAGPSGQLPVRVLAKPGQVGIDGALLSRRPAA
jgi:hypothetical protein